MLNQEILRLINNSYPNKVKDIGESISLLNLVLDELLNNINYDVTMALNEKNHGTASNYLKLHEHVCKLYDDNSEIIDYIEGIASEEVEEDIAEDVEDEKKNIPNYDDYTVDQAIPHTLYEDFEHKRPIGFKLHEKTTEAITWKSVLLKTCEMLYKMDTKIFESFVNDRNMNGKRNSYFSISENNMRNPKKLECVDIFIETNMNANSIKQVIIKMLKKYKIKLQDYVVFYRADYTELNK